MDKKYELTDETLEFNRRTLHRIVALKDFDGIMKGDKGGWLESENNLSQEGTCWVYGEAKVYDAAEVRGNARVYDQAEVCGEAKVYDYALVLGEVEVFDGARVYDEAKVYGAARVYSRAEVHGYAQVYGNALVYGLAKVYGGARVYGEANVYGLAKVYGKAGVYGNAHIYGYAKVCNKAEVHAEAMLYSGTTKSDDDYVVIGPQGSRHSFATYHIPSNIVCTGCFIGTLDEFEAAVKKTHKRLPKYLKQYKLVISVFNACKR